MKPGNLLFCPALLLTACSITPAWAGVSDMLAAAGAVPATPAPANSPAQATAGHTRPATPAPPATVPTEDLKRCYGLKTDDDKLQCYLALTIRALPEPPAAVHAPGAITVAALASSNAVSQVVAEAQKEATTPSEAEKQRIKQHQAFMDLRKVILDHQEPTYFNFSSGVRLGNDKATSNLLYDAQIMKNVSITDSAQIHDYSDFFWIDAPVRIGVRQQTDPSLPVRTPTFNPGLRLTWAPRLQSNYFSVGVHHYSNGQDDTSTRSDGTVNTRNGSFNTNYIELAAQHHNAQDPHDPNWYQIAFRQHLYGTFESFQRGQYPRQQLIFGVHHTAKQFRFLGMGKVIDEVQLRLTNTVGLGYQYVAKNDVDTSKNVPARWSDRLNTRLELIGIPKGTEELGLYLRYDYGYDYYNINFQRRINRFQIGVAALIR